MKLKILKMMQSIEIIYMMMDCTLKWMLLKTSLKISLFFLNHKIDFGEQINWNLSEDESKSRLWTFHLHYFDYLVDIAKLYIVKSDKKYFQYIKKTFIGLELP